MTTKIMERGTKTTNDRTTRNEERGANNEERGTRNEETVGPPGRGRREGSHPARSAGARWAVYSPVLVASPKHGTLSPDTQSLRSFLRDDRGRARSLSAHQRPLRRTAIASFLVPRSSLSVILPPSSFPQIPPRITSSWRATAVSTVSGTVNAPANAARGSVGALRPACWR